MFMAAFGVSTFLEKHRLQAGLIPPGDNSQPLYVKSEAGKSRLLAISGRKPFKLPPDISENILI